MRLSGAKPLVRASSSASSVQPETQTPQRLVPMPDTPEQQVSLAVSACEAAWRAGMKLQAVEILLPLIYATDLDDWPGGIRQQFFAAQPLVESVLKSLKKVEGLQGPLGAEMWDQGDAVGAWQGQKLGAVLFPTASTLDKLRTLATKAGGPELVMIVNPQWENTGGVSDFGFGQRKADAEAFIASFQPAFCFRQLRVYGDSIRVLKAYPSKWQVHLIAKDGSNTCIATMDEQPTYQQIEQLLRARPSSSVNKSVMERLKDEYQFVQDSLKSPPQ